jgi:hypothetical protein
LRQVDHPSRESYRLYKNDYKIEYEARALNGLEEPVKRNSQVLYKRRGKIQANTGES